MGDADHHIEYLAASAVGLKDWKNEIEYKLGVLSATQFNNMFSCLQNHVLYIDKQRYSLKSAISMGKYGTIVSAKDLETSQIVIVTERSNIYNLGSISTIHEIQLLQTYRHQNILSLVDVQFNYGKIYMITEEYHTTLKDLKSRANYYDKFQDMDFIEILHQILQALSFLHSHKMVYNNIQPSSVVLFISYPTIHVKLSDFSFSQPLNSSFQLHNVLYDLNESELHYRLWYSAPELLKSTSTRLLISSSAQYQPVNYSLHEFAADSEDEGNTPRKKQLAVLGLIPACAPLGLEVDIWATGCLFLELLRGVVLFPGHSVSSQRQLISNSVLSDEEKRLYQRPDRERLPDVGKFAPVVDPVEDEDSDSDGGRAPWQRRADSGFSLMSDMSYDTTHNTHGGEDANLQSISSKKLVEVLHTIPFIRKHPPLSSLLQDMLRWEASQRVTSQDAVYHHAFYETSTMQSVSHGIRTPRGAPIGPKPDVVSSTQLGPPEETTGSAEGATRRRSEGWTPTSGLSGAAAKNEIFNCLLDSAIPCQHPDDLACRTEYVEEMVADIRKKVVQWRTRRPSRLTIDIDYDAQDADSDTQVLPSLSESLYESYRGGSGSRGDESKDVRDDTWETASNPVDELYVDYDMDRTEGGDSSDTVQFARVRSPHKAVKRDSLGGYDTDTIEYDLEGEAHTCSSSITDPDGPAFTPTPTHAELSVRRTMGFSMASMANDDASVEGAATHAGLGRLTHFSFHEAELGENHSSSSSNGKTSAMTRGPRVPRDEQKSAPAAASLEPSSKSEDTSLFQRNSRRPEIPRINLSQQTAANAEQGWTVSDYQLSSRRSDVRSSRSSPRSPRKSEKEGSSNSGSSRQSSPPQIFSARRQHPPTLNKEAEWIRNELALSAREEEGPSHSIASMTIPLGSRAKAKNFLSKTKVIQDQEFSYLTVDVTNQERTLRPISSPAGAPTPAPTPTAASLPAASLNVPHLKLSPTSSTTTAPNLLSSRSSSSRPNSTRSESPLTTGINTSPLVSGTTSHPLGSNTNRSSSPLLGNRHSARLTPINASSSQNSPRTGHHDKSRHNSNPAVEPPEEQSAREMLSLVRQGAVPLSRNGGHHRMTVDTQDLGSSWEHSSLGSPSKLSPVADFQDSLLSSPLHSPAFVKSIPRLRDHSKSPALAPLTGMASQSHPASHDDGSHGHLVKKQFPLSSPMTMADSLHLGGTVPSEALAAVRDIVGKKVSPKNSVLPPLRVNSAVTPASTSNALVESHHAGSTPSKREKERKTRNLI